MTQFTITRRHRRQLTAMAILLATSTGLAVMAAVAPTTSTAPAQTPAAVQVSPAQAEAAAAQFQKAKDLFDQKKYAEAQVENDKALQLDPSHSQALLLKRVLQDKLAGGEGTGGGNTATTGKPKLLTTQQISIIRLLETPDGDNSIRGTVPRKALDDFWKNYWQKEQGADTSKAALDAFMSPNNFPLQAHRIKDSRQMEYIQQVNVTNDPANMIAFKNNIHTFALQNCATAECHGGEKGGTFRLITGNTTPEAMYTNFYIMSMYTLKATPGVNGGKMIDRNNPDKSLLAQFALPRNVAANPHPKVETRKIGTMQDPRYKQILDWVNSLTVPTPNYGITYEAPGLTPPAATPPATTQAATRP